MARSSISVLALAAVVLVLASFSSAFIVNNPTTTAVAAGSNAVFTATTSAGVWNFQWLFSINNGASYEIVPGATGATAAGGGAVTLTINNALRSYDGFLYLVQISNAAGDRFTSTAARLTIRKAPRILAQPADTLVDSGAPATFSVTAVAEETIVYAWEVSADQGLTWTPIVGATSATFTTGATTPAMLFRRYRVRLTTATFTAPVTSNEAVLRVAFVTITAQPASVTVPEGAQGSFSIAYTSFPAATVLWQASGAGAVFADVPGGSGAQSTTYTTVPTTFDMSGRTFQAVVSNGRVSVNSGPATLSVNKRIVILTQPVSVTLVEGSAATFVVTASGTSPLVYRWQVSSDNSASWTDVPLPAGGLPTLVLPTVSRTMNSLRYRVLVSTTDTLGTTTLISSTATLTVVYLPTILSQPARSVVVVNDLVTFGVLVDANPPATYVWQSSVRNDAAATFANIAVDATGPSYRVRSTTLLDSTFYRVIVSNSQGSVTSDVVEVRVNHPRN